MQIKNSNKKRNVTLDIIRIFALFCVVSVHFFLNCGFYDEIVNGKKMYIMFVSRAFFITCVPLFLMLTGFLVNKKEVSKKYYKGIIKVLIIYIICSVIYSIFTKIYIKEDMNFNIFFSKLIGFQGTRYAWYIEMYVGLFLLIPFFNILVNNIKNKKEYNILLLTFAIIMGLPCIINKSDYKILSDWWIGIYPVFYFLLGAYLNKYKVKLSIKANIISLIICTLVSGTFNFYKAFGGKFVWENWNGYSSLFVMIESFLVFNLLLKIKFKNENELRNKFLKVLSDACLGAYLISCMYDKIIYDKLEVLVPIVKQRFIYAPIAVILCFTCSIITSILINILYKHILKIIIKIKNNKIKKLDNNISSEKNDVEKSLLEIK